MSTRENWRKRERNKKALAPLERECWLCLGARGPLDFTLPAGHPLAVELDEEVPVSKGGRADDIRNNHLVHRCCNLEKGARILPRGAFAAVSAEKGGGPVVSRDWFSA